MSDWDSEIRVGDLPDRNHDANPLIGNADDVQTGARNLSPSYYANTLSNFCVIAILGATGAGKSTFIQRAAGLEHSAAHPALKIKALKEEQMSPGSEVDLLEYLDELERNLEKLEAEQKRLRVWKALSGGALQAAMIAAQFTVAASMCNVI